MMDVLFWIKFSWLRVELALMRLYIIGLIVARIYADYFLSNIVEYFGDILMLSAPYAAKIINIRDGLAGIFGVVGALLLDLYLTHHGMTFLASIFYVVGLSVVTYGDTKRGMTRENMVFTGFFLTGVGKYSLRNSSDALADEKDPDNLNNPFKNLIKLFRGSDSRILRFLEFHEHVILMVFVKYGTKIAVIAVSTIVNLKLKRLADEAEKWWNGKFLIPTIGFALVTFVSLFYSKSFVKPYEKRGTPLKNVIRVFVAAILKRHHPLHQHPMEEALYEETAEHSLKHTNSLRFLDKAAIVESTQPEEERRKWRLSTLREVEETKRMLHMVPMCTTFLAYGMVKSIGNTFFFQQGNFMDSTLGHLNLELPLQTLLLLSDISSAGIKGLFTLTLSKKLQGVGKKYTSPIKYAIGLILATFCCTVAAWIANDKGKADRSVFWLTPQFILFGAMSGITRDAIEGFFHEQLPPSMMRYDSVLTDAMIGVGAIFSVALVHANNYFPITERALGNSGGSKLDLAHLSRFYRLTTVVSFIILSVYTFVATRFHYQDYKEEKQNEENQEAVV